MARLMSIDYGRKRCGIAVTDPCCIVATALDTIPTSRLIEFILAYITREKVERIVVGLPRTLDGRPSESMRYIEPGIRRLRAALPDDGPEIVFWDERFTSTLAHRAMIDSGMRKMQRRDKAAVDQMAATIILNDYIESKTFRNS